MSGRVNLMAALSTVSGPGCRLWNRLAGYARSRTFSHGRVVSGHGEVMRAAGQLTELIAGCTGALQFDSLVERGGVFPMVNKIAGQIGQHAAVGIVCRGRPAQRRRPGRTRAGYVDRECRQGLHGRSEEHTSE